jgi:hypothetical protein
MSGRERVLTALDHQADRVPIEFGRPAVGLLSAGHGYRALYDFWT